MKAFVTGGNGFIGRRLVDALLLQGHNVSALTRQPKADFPSGIAWVVGDLSVNGAPDHTVLSALDVIFHCAGEIKDVALMRGLHVDGTRRLLELACRVAEGQGKPIHWVQLSSAGVYGPPQGRANAERIITESTPEKPVSEYEVTKLDSDRLVAEAARSGVLTYSILRPANVFGAGMPNQSLRKLIDTVKRRMFFYMGRPGAIATYVHVDDVVAALLKCGTDARARRQIYNLSNDCSLEEMIQGIATALGVSPPCTRLPEGFVRGIVRVISGIVPFPLTQERINGLVRRTKYSTAKIETELNYKATRSVPEAMREMVREYCR